MTAKMDHVQSDNGHNLAEQVSRIIRNYETGQVSVQVVTTMMSDPRTHGGTKFLYEAYIIHPVQGKG